MDGVKVRVATVKGAHSFSQLDAYMPRNYKVIVLTNGEFVIVGFDFAGWTLDGYVIPRLASGLIWATEITKG